MFVDDDGVRELRLKFWSISLPFSNSDPNFSRLDRICNSFGPSNGESPVNTDHGMVLTLPSAAAKALPITLKEFGKSLSSTWNHHVSTPHLPTTLGLAISGGVDSMALASLCAALQSLGSSDWRFQAFVVDHGARAGSDEEAKAVAELVNKKGIETKVLKIKWPKDLILSKSSKFESLARTYRFRILGEACRDSNVRSLLLAHHEDDHYETILMRLAVGHKGRGLLGMKPNVQIPECYGIYGVYDSGSGATDNTGVASNERRVGSPQLGHMHHEDGGIRVLRPLLQYSKDRLVATCLQSDTSWFEDHTNADPTLTLRNAIRHIYKQHSLPTALQKDRIVPLSSALQQKKNGQETEALAFLNHCITRDFQPRSGSLVVRFPKLTSLEINQANAKEQTGSWQTQREVACRLLKYAIETVSPYEHTQYPLDRVCKYVFPELTSANDQEKACPGRFTAAGVMFERNELNISEDEKAPCEAEADHQEPQQHSPSFPMQDCEWLLSRQPYPSMLGRRPLLEYPPQVVFRDSNDGWQFYDGRYWIRIVNHTQSTIKVRPLHKRDLAAFKRVKYISQRLKTIARGDLRFALPVIVMGAAGQGESDRPLALPTLDVMVNGARKLMEYEIRYKKVDWPRLQEMGTITRQLTIGG